MDILTFGNPSIILETIPLLERIVNVISGNTEILIGLISALVAIYLPLGFGIFDNREKDEFHSLDIDLIKKSIFDLKWIITSIIVSFLSLFPIKSGVCYLRKHLFIILIISSLTYLTTKLFSIYRWKSDSQYKTDKRLEFLRNEESKTYYRESILSSESLENEDRFMEVFREKIKRYINNDDLSKATLISIIKRNYL